jgi:hypothetical protein
LRFALGAAAPLLDAGLRDVSLARDIADLVVMNTFKLGVWRGDQAKAASCGANSTKQLFALGEQGSTLS